MQIRNDLYTSREEVEKLLKDTLEGTGNKKNKPDQQKAADRKKQIVQHVIYGLLILSMLVMLGKVWYQKLNGQTPSLFGYQIYVVETGSMVPTLPIGTNILVRQLTDNMELNAGDIITYTYHDMTITHRIIDTEVGDDGILRYQTKGDNPENSRDPWLVERENVCGVVIWHFSLANLLGK